MAVGTPGGSRLSVCSNQSGPSISGPPDLERAFEEEFSQYVKERTKVQQWQFGAVGVGVGGAIGLAVAPVVLPGVAVGGLIAGASGFGWARSKGQREVKDDGNDGLSPSQESQRPSRRRLKYLVKWGQKQLIEGEKTAEDQKALVVDEVVRAFSPWVQQLFLLRARGAAVESDPDARNVFMHLMALYYFLQQTGPAQVVVQAASLISQMLNNGVVDAVCQSRCLIVFPTILEVISTMDRLSDATHAEQMRRLFGLWEDVSLLPRAERRGSFQLIVAAIHRVLDRQDFQEAMSRSVAPMTPSGGARCMYKSDGNGSDSEFYSCSDEENSASSNNRGCSGYQNSSNSNSADLAARAIQNGCGHELHAAGNDLKKGDPALEHYKKSGVWGGFTGLFGDKKTMYCHHITAKGEFAVRAAGAKRFSSETEVWQFLGKNCCGRFTFDSRKRALICGSLVQHDHDRTCNHETCLFCRNGLTCPVPAWALKK